MGVNLHDSLIKSKLLALHQCVKVSINTDIILGWLYKLKVKDANELKELMNETAYEAFKKIEEREAAH